LSGLEGTYAVPLTGPGHLQQLGDATPPRETLGMVEVRERDAPVD
jgi:hypothetical protein